MGANAFEMTQGEDVTLTLTVTQGGAAYNITGATIAFTMKKDKSSNKDADVVKTTADAAEVDLTDPSNGVAEIYLLPADTTYLEPGLYDFDVRMKVSGGTQSVIVKPDEITLGKKVSDVIA